MNLIQNLEIKQYFSLNLQKHFQFFLLSNFKKLKSLHNYSLQYNLPNLLKHDTD